MVYEDMNQDGPVKGTDFSDWFRGGPGPDRLEGGLHEPTDPDKYARGFGDTVDYTGSNQGVNVDLGDQDGHRTLAELNIIPNISGGYAEGDQLEGIENAVGSKYNDNLVGDSADNKLFGGRGSDFLWGDSGDDSLWGDFHGGSMLGDDDVRLGGHDRLYGFTGKDMLEGGAGGDLLDGGPGVDVASYLKSHEGVTVDLNRTEIGPDGKTMYGTGKGGHAEGDLLVDIENVYGSHHDDLLTGDMGANLLWGRGGDDTLDGGAGDDELWGGAGNDTVMGKGGEDHLVGDVGSDTLEGGAGDDWISGDGGAAGTSHAGYRDAVSYESYAHSVTVDLSNVNPRTGAVEAEGDDLFGIEDVVGSKMHGDTLRGDGSANRIWGLGGDDYINGGHGADTLDGGKGDDWIVGSFGDDELTGGLGADAFSFFDVFGDDTITDFTNGSDAIWIPQLSSTDLQAVLDNRTLNEDGDVVLTFDHAPYGDPLRGTITLEGYDLSDDLEVSIFQFLT